MACCTSRNPSGETTEMLLFSISSTLAIPAGILSCPAWTATSMVYSTLYLESLVAEESFLLE